MVEGFEHIEDLWVLVEELPSEGGATPSGSKQQDVFPWKLRGHQTVITQGSPPDVFKIEGTELYVSEKLNLYQL